MFNGRKEGEKWNRKKKRRKGEEEEEEEEKEDNEKKKNWELLQANSVLHSCTHILNGNGRNVNKPLLFYDEELEIKYIV